MVLLIMIGITLYIISGGLIKIILEILSGEKNTETDRIGMTIGYCERLLTIAFVMLNQYTALGLLVAAKSILRFSGDKSSESVRKESEYVLVGTMLSLVFGIVNGLIFMFAFKI
ncbi:hypothetical protein LNK15_08355 [Jeotgalicoccus huakuii]|nr:hypothetical protein [Jeotgalicoccus huakuii]